MSRDHVGVTNVADGYERNRNKAFELNDNFYYSRKIHASFSLAVTRIILSLFSPHDVSPDGLVTSYVP